MLLACRGAEAKARISHPSSGNVGLLGIEMQISLHKNFNSRLNFRFSFQASCLDYFNLMTRFNSKFLEWDAQYGLLSINIGCWIYLSIPLNLLLQDFYFLIPNI